MNGQENLAAQEIARRTMEAAARMLRPGMTEAAVASLVEEKLREEGSGEFWYHGVGALVLAGRGRSCLSVSGRDYRPDGSVVLGEDDLVSIDLSPTRDGFWGDYARTVYLEGGRARLEPEEPKTPEFADGYRTELFLHRELAAIVGPDTTYREVWERMNGLIDRAGYENLDFHGNLGHSIERDPAARIYLEAGNRRGIREYGKPFTFEPHIRKKGGGWGFKREEIYIWENGRVRPL